ncbi:MAG: hypothetical protein PVI09_18700, partial [Anaerolineae bacterium]
MRRSHPLPASILCLLPMLIGLLSMEPMQSSYATSVPSVTGDTRSRDTLPAPDGSFELADSFGKVLDPAGGRKWIAEDGTPLFHPAVPPSAALASADI